MITDKFLTNGCYKNDVSHFAGQNNTFLKFNKEDVLRLIRQSQLIEKTIMEANKSVVMKNSELEELLALAEECLDGIGDDKKFKESLLKFTSVKLNIKELILETHLKPHLFCYILDTISILKKKHRIKDFCSLFLEINIDQKSSKFIPGFIHGVVSLDGASVLLKKYEKSKPFLREFDYFFG